MKRIAFCVLLFGSTLFAFAQEKDDRKITITPADTANLFDKVVVLLYTEGYTIKSEDKARGFLSTDYKQIKTPGAADLTMKFLFVNNTILMTGIAKSNVSFSFGGAKAETITWDVEYKKSKGNTLRHAWDEMDRFAKLIGSVSYSK